MASPLDVVSLLVALSSACCERPHRGRCRQLFWGWVGRPHLEPSKGRKSGRNPKPQTRRACRTSHPRWLGEVLKHEAS